MNMLSTIQPKSDQLNSDDLIGGRTMTIMVTKVSILAGEQPVGIHFEGDGGKPYRPGKSMRRVLVSLWGPDANAYVGRSMTLYRDEKVQFGGFTVGGIRISHMSHIDKEITLALTATKASRKPFTVKPLKVEALAAAPSASEWLRALKADLDAAQDAEAVDGILGEPDVVAALGDVKLAARINAFAKAAMDRVGDAQDGFPGTTQTDGAGP